MSSPYEEVVIDYTNWCGERAYRRVRPLRIAFENNEWHHDTQWLLEADDLEKGEIRTFAMATIHQWLPVTEIDKARSLLSDKVSTSYLQRKMQIGYNRASAIMDFFEKTGVVSEPSASGVRSLIQ